MASVYMRYKALTGSKTYDVDAQIAIRYQALTRCDAMRHRRRSLAQFNTKQLLPKLRTITQISCPLHYPQCAILTGGFEPWRCMLFFHHALMTAQ
jgi:hypothetical protein